MPFRGILTTLGNFIQHLGGTLSRHKENTRNKRKRLRKTPKLLVGSSVFWERPLNVNFFSINMAHLELTQQCKPNQPMLYFWKPNSSPTELTKFFHFILVISKETVGNSWDILNAILGHNWISSLESLKQGHIRSSEWSQHLQQKWLIQSVDGWVLSTRSIVLPTSALRKRARLLTN